MFQNFEDDLFLGQTKPRLLEFRKGLKDENLDGFMLQRTDEYMNEYVAAYAERLAWLTGFTGSTGQAIILKNKAAIFVDGRYTLQVQQQVPEDLFESFLITEKNPKTWLKENVITEGRIGFDPKLFTIDQIETLEKSLTTSKISLVPLKNNLIDKIWNDQPSPPKELVKVHPLKYSGLDAAKKIQSLQKELKSAEQTYTVITKPDSIAWLFNIRGQDVPHTPIALCFAILHVDQKPSLFIDEEKLSNSSRKHIKKYADIAPISKLSSHLKDIGKKKEKVRLDHQSTSYWFALELRKSGAELINQKDLCLLPKAIKNNTEIEGAREAHIRDGVAVSRFLYWLDKSAKEEKIDEILVAQKLESFRQETKLLKDISFDTISGAGPNGAIVHYRVTKSTNRVLKSGSLYLVDSGAQYQDGTTDITRTIAIGQPTKEMKTRFTQVLKGMIAVTCARFPKETTGSSLDMLARHALWQAGVDYAHGTGHGVGSYLSVHEGPQGISKKSNVTLEPGMIVSNEPGYYKSGKYGIRIENLILVKEPAPIRGGEVEMMSFETLTLAPIDPNLIDITLLSDDELNWLNQYHNRVYKTISPKLNSEQKNWLRQVTQKMTKKQI